MLFSSHLRGKGNNRGGGKGLLGKGRRLSCEPSSDPALHLEQSDWLGLKQE